MSALTGAHSRNPHLARLGDGELMAMVSVGNREAFGVLYDRYCGRAHGVALSVCRDDGRAQEAVQDGFLSVWNRRASYCSEHGTVAGWLLTVVRNRAIDLARTDGRFAARRDADAVLAMRPAPDDVFAAAIRRDEAARLRMLLKLLPAAQAEVITLGFYDELSHREIAARLGLPSGTVKGRMRLGLEKLRSLEHAAA